MKTLEITSQLKTNIRIWIQELRSGKYQQTQERLQDDNGFCCLGVACKAFIPKEKLSIEDGLDYMNGVEPSEQPNSPQWLKDISDDFKDRTGLNLETLNDEGIEFEVDDYEGADEDDGYIRHSRDSRGELTGQVQFKQPMTFDEIADMLQLVYLEGA